MSEQAKEFARQYHNHVHEVANGEGGPVNYTVWSWDEMTQEHRDLLTLAAERWLTEPTTITAEQPDFQTELQAVLNRHSQEGHSNTPDFLLAQFITQCVEAFNTATKARDAWYGVQLSPIPDRYKNLVPPGTNVLVRCEHDHAVGGHCLNVECPNYAGRFGQ